MRSLLERVESLAPANDPLLIRGEPGAGKEVIARTVHANGNRRDRPFVVLNCAASEAARLHSELFGAPMQRGLFEVAGGGTLFLDEIADIPLDVQARLLRAVEDHEVKPLGGEVVHVDLRVIGSSARDLETAVREGRFREDLFYRLNVFTLTVPPLRERGDDVLELAEMFLAQLGHQGGLTPTALLALRAYGWPGNVRELHSAVRHAAAISRGAPVEPKHLPEAVTHIAQKRETRLLTLEEAERKHIIAVLEACGGEQVEAARVLGIGRTTLWRKLRHYGLISK
ncbi:MAG: sigma-54-dependent Fis family transcriptional regulator [Archangium sp.]|nr:sigma-54-dependent Fis family transcriptional regulator [Archangium sp.]